MANNNTDQRQGRFERPCHRRHHHTMHVCSSDITTIIINLEEHEKKKGYAYFTETHLAGAPYYNYLGKDRTLCNCCTPYSMLLLNESCNVYIAVESLRTQNTDSPGPWQLVGRII